MSTQSADLRRANTTRRRLEDYRGVAPERVVDEVRALGHMLDGARVLHVTTDSADHDAVERTVAQVALMRDVGLDADLRVIWPERAFTASARRIHDALLGEPLPLRANDIATYLEYNRLWADQIGDGWDIVVAHDPQLLVLIVSEATREGRFVWCCHDDLSRHDFSAWDLLRPFAWAYDAAVFALPPFVPCDFPREQVAIVTPAIDPLNARNSALAPDLSRRIVAARGVDLARPFIFCRLRLDGHDDLPGLLTAWSEARRQVPGLQLVFVAALESDPNQFARYSEVASAVTREHDLHLLTNLEGIGPTEVNAFAREADLAVQKSRRPCLDLSVAEALWKDTPVVGDYTAGLAAQLGDGEGGLLVGAADEWADAIVALLEDEELVAAKSRAGRERVRRHFLIPRVVRDELQLYSSLLQVRGSAQATGDEALRRHAAGWPHGSGPRSAS